MTLLILLLLVVAIITYAIFFGIFKLIWILCKSNRNMWPLILAGVCTLFLALLVALSVGWGVNKVMKPFQTMRAEIKNNPQPIYGQHTYKEGMAPYSLTVMDGIDFSDWIHFASGDVKLGIDTNLFKAKKDDTKTYLAGALARRQHPQGETFQQMWNSAKDKEDIQGRIQIASEKEITVNGMPGYLLNGTAYTNRGPLPFWFQAVEAEPQMTYYLVFVTLGRTEDKTEQVQRMLQSFRSSNLPIATPDNVPAPAPAQQP